MSVSLLSHFLPLLLRDDASLHPCHWSAHVAPSSHGFDPPTLAMAQLSIGYVGFPPGVQADAFSGGPSATVSGNGIPALRRGFYFPVSLFAPLTDTPSATRPADKSGSAPNLLAMVRWTYVQTNLARTALLTAALTGPHSRGKVRVLPLSVHPVNIRFHRVYLQMPHSDWLTLATYSSDQESRLPSRF